MVTVVQQREHKPVLLDEVVEYLRCAAGKCFVDGTVGGGGHARAILEKSSPGGRLIGIDWDEYALAQARLNLQPYGERVILVRDNFARLDSILPRLQIEAVDGILLDLGLSSMQIDDAERGFSFNQPGPLDMRMDRRGEIAAHELVNAMSEEELAGIIRRFGEERWSRRIARNIIRARGQQDITTTERLAEIVCAAIPPGKSPPNRHPATRTFQALRLAVNREIDHLRTFLQGALDWLRPGGRLAIISFHSLEDRVVKQRFRHWARVCRCPVHIPICSCEGSPLVRLVTKKPLFPTPDEVRANPRARSGRLRVLEKIESS